MAREYTENQKLAIEADGFDLCVAAGAGSGKTGVLVERYVRIIQQSLEGKLPIDLCAGVEEILVITFTEKATKEMKTRIVEALTALGLIEERRKVETAYISTIHGFCSRLLKENPFEAGIDPQFSTLDDTQSRRLLRQTFDKVVADAYDNDDQETIELIAAVQNAKFMSFESPDPMGQLLKSVETILSKLRGAGIDLEEAEKHWQAGVEATSKAGLEPVTHLLKPLMNELKAADEVFRTLSTSLTGTAKAVCDSVSAIIVRLGLASSGLHETIAILQELNTLIAKSGRRFGLDTGEREFSLWTGRLKILCEECAHLFRLVAEQEEMSARNCHRVWGLVVSVWRAYQSEKRVIGKVDSDDLQAEAVKLLETSLSVRDRYRKSLRYLMVDEFQDTSPIQMRLINVLHDKRHTKHRNQLFIVGDVQQSIYGFRNAEPSLFRKLEHDYREEKVGTHVSLAVNFRSRPEILRLIEQTFRQVWRNSETPFVALECGAPFVGKPSPSVELLVSGNLMRRDYVALEASALASRIRQMVDGRELTLTSRFDKRCGDPVAYGDIAILLRQLTDIQKYEEAFAKEGVPFFVVGGGRGYYARQEIRDLLNILIAIDTPMNDVALLSTLRSPMVGADTDTLGKLAKLARNFSSQNENPPQNGRLKGRFPLYPALKKLISCETLPGAEQEKLTQIVTIIEELREVEDRLPVGHLLEKLISATRYDARLLCRPGGRRRLANIRKLLQIANADPVMGVREFVLRLQDMERLSEREGDAPTEEEEADVVRILTIHGAKGLEFPVVILADLCRSIEFSERGLFNCDPRTLAIGTRLPNEANLSYRAIDRLRQKAERQESERLLYVAMTRAREHLILCGNLGKNRGLNWGDQLFSQLGVLEVPPQPLVQTLIGGLEARIAPMTHYSGSSPAGLTTPNTATTGHETDANRRLERLSELLKRVAIPERE